MDIPRHSLHVAFVTLLLFAGGCSSRSNGPVVGPIETRRTMDVNVLDGDDVTIPVSTMERFIANRLPGIVVRRGSIVIRRGGSFASSNEALIVVDGRAMPTRTFLEMNPSDVRRIEVLRGADAAIWGRRGANGVLVVSTR